MTEKDFNKVIDDIKETLGNENVGLIADNLAILISDNTNVNNEITKKDEEIQTLKEDKERLIKTNGNLLQQVTFGKEEDIINSNKKNEEEKEYIDYKLGFDEKRKF